MPQLTLVTQKAELIAQTKEYYNALITNIRLSGKDNKVICLTSVLPNEGKSTTSANLSIAFAEAGYKTLLIDADTRNSIMSGTFRAQTKIQGLSSYLAGEVELTDVICETTVPNLSVITSGPVPPNPTTLLQGSNFQNMIQVFKKHYDYVIIDTPPVGLVIDAVLVAQNCDASIVVAASGIPKRKEVQRVVNQMEATGAQFLGLVLNKYDVKTEQYGAYGSYGNYGNYGK